MLVFVTFMMSPTSNFNAVLSYAFGTRACFTHAYAGNFLCEKHNEFVLMKSHLRERMQWNDTNDTIQLIYINIDLCASVNM